jgi:hypothetical protein
MNQPNPKEDEATGSVGDADQQTEDKPENPTAESLFGILGQRFRPGRATKTIVYHFCIDDRDWTLIVSSEAFEVLDGKPPAPDCYLKTTSEILIGTVRGEYTPSFSDFLSGKIRSNNPQVLLTLKSVFGDS